jgi:hypothetical protein
MPTSFDITTTLEAEDMVKRNACEEIEKYILQEPPCIYLTYIRPNYDKEKNISITENDEEIIICDEETDLCTIKKKRTGCVYTFESCCNKAEVCDSHTNIFFIANAAVKQGNLDVLKQLGTRLKVSYRAGGNQYNLLKLATELKNREIIDLLCEIAKNNDEDIKTDLNYASRSVISPDYDNSWIDYFMTKNVDSWDMSHYSKYLEFPEKTQYIETKYGKQQYCCLTNSLTS